jgi:hypothetical protein
MAAVRLKCDQRPARKIHPFKGFGAQLNTNIFRPTSIFPNPELAAQDHPKNPDQEGQPRALTPAQQVKLRESIANLRPGHSRVFVGRVLVSTPEPPPKELAALLSTLQLAQDAGANVNLTFWGQGPYAGKAKLKKLPWPEPRLRAWPPQKEQQGKLKWPPGLMDGGDVTGPAELMHRFAKIIARIQEKGLTCVKYVTIQNEPNQGTTDLAQMGSPVLAMRFYERLYRLLDESLRKLGVRAAVELVGGDLVLEGNSSQKDWLTYIRSCMDVARPKFRSVVDAYSIHVYWAPGDGPKGFPQRLESRLTGLVTQLNSCKIDKPVYVTEFGVKKLGASAKPEPGGPGSGQTIEFSPDVAFQHAWFMALAPQYGCAGLVKWVLYRTDRKSAWGEWGMIDAPNPPPGRTSFARSPTYRVTRLFNHLVERDWTADGFGKSNDGTALASRFKGPAHESVVVLNRRSTPQQVVVEGLRAQKYFAADWNQDGDGGPAQERAEPLVPTAKALTLTVPARGVVGLSTRPLQLA